jgi:hypothetical protein
MNFMKNCSFCGKRPADLKKLIVGPSVSICDECIGLARECVNNSPVFKEEQSWARASAARLFSCPGTLRIPDDAIVSEGTSSAYGVGFWVEALVFVPGPTALDSKPKVGQNAKPKQERKTRHG